MKSAAFIAATAFASSSYAATVTLETTKCLNDNTPLEQFNIEIGTSKPVAKDLPTVCGLRILSASDGIDVTTVQCQAFRDTEGTVPGSALFTFDKAASIATNPIQEKSILCTIPSSLNRRQDDNSTASSADPISSTAVLSAPQSTVFITSTASDPEATAVVNSTSSADPSTIVRTVIASTASALPSSSGNATAPSNTGTPSATQSGANPAETTGAAGTIGIGVGVVAAAFAAMLL